MSTCPSCRAFNHEGNRVCDQCGAQLGSQPGSGRIIRVGRETDNDLVLPNNVSQASRYQAQVSISPGGELVISDMGSANGTFVNGTRITGPTRFTMADRIQFGSFVVNPVLLQPYLSASPHQQALVPQYAPPAPMPVAAPPYRQPYACPPPVMAPAASAPPRRKGVGLGVTALIFGINGLILSFIFFIPPVMFLGFFCCIMGFIFGIVSAATGHGRGMGITGLVFSLVPGVLVLVALLTAGSLFGGALDLAGF